jgi:hypothetical protein
VGRSRAEEHSNPVSQCELQGIELTWVSQEITERFYNPIVRCACTPMSALGQKLPRPTQAAMSALLPKADTALRSRGVRYGPQADIWLLVQNKRGRQLRRPTSCPYPAAAVAAVGRRVCLLPCPRVFAKLEPFQAVTPRRPGSVASAAKSAAIVAYIL